MSDLRCPGLDTASVRGDHRCGTSALPPSASKVPTLRHALRKLRKGGVLVCHRHALTRSVSYTRVRGPAPGRGRSPWPDSTERQATPLTPDSVAALKLSLPLVGYLNTFHGLLLARETPV